MEAGEVGGPAELLVSRQDRVDRWLIEGDDLAENGQRPSVSDENVELIELTSLGPGLLPAPDASDLALSVVIDVPEEVAGSAIDADLGKTSAAFG